MKRIACIGIVSLVGLLALGCGEIVKGIQKTGAAGDAKVKAVLPLIAAGDADAIYDGHVTTGFQAQTSRQEWADMVRRFQVLGQPVSWTRTNTSFNTVNGVTTGKCDYNVTWADGKGTLKMELLETGGTWKISMIEINGDFSHTRVTKLARQTLEAIAQGNADEVYSNLASEKFRQNVTPQRWSELVTVLKQFGQPKSVEIARDEMFNDTGELSGNYTFNVQWDNVTSEMVLSAVRQDNTWKVLGVDASKALQKFNSR